MRGVFSVIVCSIWWHSQYYECWLPFDEAPQHICPGSRGVGLLHAKIQLGHPSLKTNDNGAHCTDWVKPGEAEIIIISDDYPIILPPTPTGQQD